MGFWNAIIELIQDFFESVFASSSPEYKKKHQLKQINASLKLVDPPIYRLDGILLPAFPAALYQTYQFLKPIRDILTTTIANTDKRASERYRDFLIEIAFTDDQRAIRKSFHFSERSSALIAQQMPPDKVIEEQGKRFSQFLKVLDTPPMKHAGKILQQLDCVTDFCQFDYNGFFSSFDPAFRAHVGQETTVDAPSFGQIEVGEVIPGLLDLYYLLSKLELSQPIIDLIAILDAKRTDTAPSEDSNVRIQKTFQAIQWLLQKRINKEIILSVIRLAKNDPEFVPQQPDIVTDYILEYKTRITEFFHSDSRKLVKEQQETAIQKLITATFGSMALDPITGYNETTSALLQEFTPLSLEWTTPMQLIKTFTTRFFIPHFQRLLQSVIVEGYFNNRGLQSSLAAAYYFCESIPSKITDFEQLFGDNQPCSIKIATGYLTELEKGMDFEKPLRKMVENMNAHAKAFVQQAVNQYAEVFNFSTIILEENKKTVPEFITNIRTLSASTKNQESFSLLEKEIGVFRNFLEIMKKYAIVGTLSVPVSLAEKTES